jgi:fructokinase
MSERPFLVFGEALWDVFPEGKKLGGAPLNFAYYFARAGGRPILLSALGNDQYGREALQEIKRRHINTEHIQMNNRPTGRVIIERKGKSHRFTIVRNTAWEGIVYPDDPDLLQHASGLYLGTLSRVSRQNKQIADRLLRQMKDKPKFMDVNLRQRFYSKKDIAFLLEQIDYLKLNETESRVLKNLGLAQGRSKEHIAEFLIKTYGLKACCITLGARGAVAADKEGHIRMPALAAGPGGDAVGAGDAFGAFWLAELLRGVSLLEATTRAVETGAKVASAPGALVALP